MTLSKVFQRPLLVSGIVLIAVAALVFFIPAALQLSERNSPEDRALDYYKRAVKFIDQRNYAKARIELRNALRLKNDMLPAWRSVAEIEQTTQHWNDVILSLQRIVDLDPSDFTARSKLAKLLAFTGRNQDALELTNIGSDVGNPDPKILGLKAAILYKLDEKSKAVSLAEKALSLEPGNTDALIVVATNRTTNGDFAGALQLLESDSAVKNSDLEIQLLKLRILEQLGDPQKIEVQLRRTRGALSPRRCVAQAVDQPLSRSTSRGRSGKGRSGNNNKVSHQSGN